MFALRKSLFCPQNLHRTIVALTPNPLEEAGTKAFESFKKFKEAARLASFEERLSYKQDILEEMDEMEQQYANLYSVVVETPHQTEKSLNKVERLTQKCKRIFKTRHTTAAEITSLFEIDTREHRNAFETELALYKRSRLSLDVLNKEAVSLKEDLAVANEAASAVADCYLMHEITYGTLSIFERVLDYTEDTKE